MYTICSISLQQWPLHDSFNSLCKVKYTVSNKHLLKCMKWLYINPGSIYGFIMWAGKCSTVLCCFCGQRWLNMAYETEKTCLLIPRESRASCVFHTADEKDEIPGIGEDRWDPVSVTYPNVCCYFIFVNQMLIMNYQPDITFHFRNVHIKTAQQIQCSWLVLSSTRSFILLLF